MYTIDKKGTDFQESVGIAEELDLKMTPVVRANREGSSVNGMAVGICSVHWKSNIG